MPNAPLQARQCKHSVLCELKSVTLWNEWSKLTKSDSWYSRDAEDIKAAEFDWHAHVEAYLVFQNMSFFWLNIDLVVVTTN